MHNVRLPLFTFATSASLRVSSRSRRILLALLVSQALPAFAYDWRQFNGDPQHSGNNTAETVLGSANASTLTLRYHAALPALSDGAPVFLDGVTTTAAGVKDVVFVTTKIGGLVALDAQTGSQIWAAQFPNPSTCTSGECSNSTPVVDPNRLFVYTYGVDGFVHKVKVADGSEVSGGGWPEMTTAKPSQEKQSAALAIATISGTTFLYSAISAHNGDGGDNQGHITTINLATGTQSVFNMVCSDKATHFLNGGTPDCSTVLAGGWARPGAIYDAGTNRIFVGTGNGHYNPSLHYWGDSIVALNPFGTGYGAAPVDAYTPTNQQALENADTDLGSTAPAVLPVPATSKIQHLAVQSGKDGKLRLLNLANMSGAGAPGNLGGEIGAIINVPQGGAVRTQPAVWVNTADSSTWVFVVNTSGASGLQLTFDGSGNPSLVSKWSMGGAAASPLVANGVLYYAGSNNLVARNPITGALLWSNTTIGGIHWQSPVVACSSVYVLDQSNQLNSFGLGRARASVSGGNDQSVAAGSTFANALSVRVVDSANAAQSGVTVTFQAPASGPSAAFGGNATTTAVTNGSGIATVAAPTANGIPGSYVVSADISSGACAAQFHLTNNATKFAPLQPARLLETRFGRPSADGLFDGGGPVASGATLDLSVLNRGGVPATGVAAVALNVIVTNPSGTGFVTVWPSGSTRPVASSLNFVPGQTVAGLVIAKVGANGAVSLFNSAGNSDLIADVVGWFPTTSGLTALNPARLLDTRANDTIDGNFGAGGAVAAGAELDFTAIGRGGVPASGVGAIIMNVTATNATVGGGYLTAWPTGSTRPLASNINYIVGRTTPNLVFTQPGTGGNVALFNSAGTVDLIADVTGWFSATSELHPLVPFRMLDTRSGAVTGDGQFGGGGALGAGSRLDLTITGRDGIPLTGATAVVLNVTAVVPSANGYLTVWPSGTLLPTASNINFAPGSTTPNLVIAGIGSDGKVSIFNSAGATEVIADVLGWFSTSP
ncbi:MAG: PQQ-binding-like beta-propeller repeat protein [Rudaea sp.]